MFIPNHFYHVYNQGNNKENIFLEEANYIYFLQKVRKYIAPHADILAYCLMPNHFHFLIRTNELSGLVKEIGPVKLTALTNGFRNLESSYAQAINKKLSRTGSLFRQKTKFKLIKDEYSAVFCMHYIHQNPLKAGLVSKMENWKYSSFVDYCGTREGTLPKRELAYETLPIDRQTFYNDSYKEIEANIEKFLL